MAGICDKLPTEDEVVLIKLLDNYYKNSVAINNQPQTHPYPSESLIMALLLTQQTHQSFEILIPSKQTDNRLEDYGKYTEPANFYLDIGRK
jgi:hypothetical protein